MGQTYQRPLSPQVVQAAQQTPAKTPHLFDLAKHRLDDHFPSRIQRTAYGGPYFRCHVLFGGHRRCTALHLWRMVALTAWGHIRIKPQLLYGCGCRLTVITAVIGADNPLDHARGVFRLLNTGWPDRPRLCAMGTACCLSLAAAVTSHATMIWHAPSTLTGAFPQ